MPTTTPGRNNLDTTTSGSAVIVKAVQGTGINLSSTGVDSGTGDVTVGLAVPVAVANGGTGQTTALGARGPSGLNIESRVTMNNASLVGTATDNYVATTTTAFTGARQYTLPAANSQNPGEKIYIGDDGAAINGANVLTIARSGSDTIHNGTAVITLSSPRATIVLATDGVSNWTTVQRSPSVRVQAFSSGTTFTTTVGCKAMFVECIGGGGGGGGALGTATPTCAAGGGGAGGSYASTYIIAPKASYTYAVGGGGAAGTAAGGNGGAGGTTSFDTGPAICSASGGNGGTGLATGGASTGAVAGGGPATSVFIGDVQIIGSDGFPAIRWSATSALGGNGGAAARGGGGVRGSVGQADGRAGGNYGGGGSGAVSLNATGQAGGAGAVGCVFITEYF